MIEQQQQYPILNCKKVSKAKTTSLKLFDEKDQKTQAQKLPHQDKHSLYQKNIPTNSVGFAYLDQTRNIFASEKSFQEIMNETRKFLQLKKQMEQDEKKREQFKKKRIQRPKSKKQQKSQKKSKKKVYQQEPLQESIILSSLDIEKFQTQNNLIKKIIQKIELISNLSQKCDIISPFLFKIQQQNENSQQQKSNKGVQNTIMNQELLLKLEGLELQIELMKRNLQDKKQEKDILTPFQIQQMCKWQIQSRKSNFLKENIIPSLLTKKYIDKENQKFYVQKLQQELDEMERQFSLINKQ